MTAVRTVRPNDRTARLAHYLPMGQVFAGRYELVDLLGQGGMGTVWRVWDHRGGEYRAAKVLSQADSASMLRFVRETGTRVDHPHVVRPRNWAGEDDRVLFTMPLIAGGSVAMLLADYGALPRRWILTLVDQLLDALETVHAAGMVHRDVKPANLLLEPTGADKPHLWLSDFGLAVVQGEPRLTRASQVLGTPGYMAPETVRGADPEPRQDLYSVGAVAAEMLTGRRPPVDGSPGVPAEDTLSAVVARLLSEDPQRRYASARDVRAALGSVTVQPDADDELIEVFDHLPDLPAGWSPRGPIEADAAAPGVRPPKVVERGETDPFPTRVQSTEPEEGPVTKQAQPPSRHPSQSEPVTPPVPERKPAPDRSGDTVVRVAYALAVIGVLLLVAAAIYWWLGG